MKKLICVLMAALMAIGSAAAAEQTEDLSLLPKTNRSVDHTRRLFEYLEQHPIIDIKRAAVDLAVSYNTISSAIRKLIDCGILHETTNAARNRVFAYQQYLDILRKDT